MSIASRDQAGSFLNFCDVKSVDSSNLEPASYKGLAFQVTIPSHRQRIDRGLFRATYTEYEIRIEVVGEQIGWTIMRRYSECRRLHCLLEKSLPPRITFPPRRIFGRNNTNFINQRVKALRTYLQDVLLFSQNEDLPDDLDSFFNISRHMAAMATLPVQGSSGRAMRPLSSLNEARDREGDTSCSQSITESTCGHQSRATRPIRGVRSVPVSRSVDDLNSELHNGITLSGRCQCRHWPSQCSETQPCALSLLSDHSCAVSARVPCNCQSSLLQSPKPIANQVGQAWASDSGSSTHCLEHIERSSSNHGLSQLHATKHGGESCNCGTLHAPQPSNTVQPSSGTSQQCNTAQQATVTSGHALTGQEYQMGQRNTAISELVPLQPVNEDEVSREKSGVSVISRIWDQVAPFLPATASVLPPTASEQPASLLVPTNKLHGDVEHTSPPYSHPDPVKTAATVPQQQQNDTATSLSSSIEDSSSEQTEADYGVGMVELTFGHSERKAKLFSGVRKVQFPDIVDLWDDIREGNVDKVVKYMTQHPSLVDTVNAHGSTPLICAAMCGHYSVVKYLVDSGANVNAANYEGCTALHYALFIHSVPVAAYLIQQGADLLYKDSEGNCPLNLAGNNELLDLMETALQAQGLV